MQTARRLAGGPLILLLGALTMVAANAWIDFAFMRMLVMVIGLAFALYGLGLALLPVFNIFLVWLRRDQVLGGPDARITLEITPQHFVVTENDDTVELPYQQIKTIQHRGQSSWVLTEGDHLISIPRHDLIEGDHDAFVFALEQAMALQEGHK